jgi:hypothetical protein
MYNCIIGSAPRNNELAHLFCKESYVLPTLLHAGPAKKQLDSLVLCVEIQFMVYYLIIAVGNRFVRVYSRVRPFRF